MAKATKTAVKKTVVKKAAVKKTAAKKAIAKKTVVKKTAVKKAAPATDKKESKTIQIKYSDKSAGQPEMVVIFDKIKKMMAPYDKKRAIILHGDKPSQAHLVSHKPVVLEGKPRNELWFVSAIIQKGYVGFYCSPPDDFKKQFSETFVKSLKGKGCFYIKKDTPEIMADIKKSIAVKYKAYVENGML